MEEEYIRYEKIIDKSDDEKELELIISVLKTKQKLN